MNAKGTATPIPALAPVERPLEGEGAEVIANNELIALVPDSLTIDVTIVNVELRVAVDAAFGGVYSRSSTERKPICVVTARVSGQSAGTQAQSTDAPLSNLPWCAFGFELGLRPIAS